MRVTFNTFNYKNLDNINKDINNVLNATEKVSKGRDLLFPDTDPVRYTNAINIQNMIDEADQFKRNAENSIVWVDNTANEINSAHSLVSTAINDHIVAALNASQDANSRKAIAHEIDQTLGNLLSISNAKYNDKYIFAGQKTDTTPFTKQERDLKLISGDKGYNLILSKAYGDLPELEEGNYTFEISKEDEFIKLVLKDSKGNIINIDSNGSDQSLEGNYLSQSLLTEYNKNAVIDTGLGVSVKLPGNVESSILRFYYKPGYKVQYNGDNKQILTNIGYHEELALNSPGSSIFQATKRTLKGTGVISENNYAASEKTKFLNIDTANVTSGDSIYIEGTDHNGIKIGAAKILSPARASLAQAEANDTERSITVTYGDYKYTITADRRAFTDIDDLTENLNEQIDNEGLSEEIGFKNDGENLLLYTKRAGNAVYLSVEGSINNKLGFTNSKLEGYGSDISYEIGDKNIPGQSITDPLSITINATFKDDKKTTITINDNKIEVMPDLDGDGKINEEEVGKAIKESMDKIDPGLKYIYNISVDKDSKNKFNVTVTLRNTNYDRQTYLSVDFKDASGNSDSQVLLRRQNNYPLDYNDNIDSFISYLQGLLKDQANVSIENGNIIVTDKREGKSFLDLNIIEKNEGIHQFINPSLQVIGSYAGQSDDTLDIIVQNKKLTVKDSMGRKILDRMSLEDYSGQPIDVGQGLSIILKDTHDNHQKVQLTGNGKLNFGDMQSIIKGDGVDVFESLQNLSDALKYNVVETGISEPSAWQSKEYKSEGKPFFDGEFKGNYNDKWIFKTKENEGLNKFHLQNELVHNVTGVVDTDAFDGGKRDIDFDIVIKTGENDPTLIHIDDQFEGIDEVIEKINDNIAPYKAYTYLEDGHIKVKTKGNTNVSLYATENSAARILGLSNDEDKSLKNTILASEAPEIHLSNKSEDDRTLILHTLKDDVWIDNEITIDKLDYESIDELVANINESGLPEDMEATVVDGRLAFSFKDDVDALIVESKGDTGLLGFNRIGDSFKLDVVSDKNQTVNEMEIDTAGKLYHVADGISVGFDEGIIYANDFFDATVGSGIRYEMDKLDVSDKNFMNVLTETGTKRNTIDSNLNFYDAFIETNEDIKATQVGSQQIDAVKAATELAQARQAYESALAATAMNSQISLLNFLK